MKNNMENRHIVVAGAGNTGSHLLPHLARTSGIARLSSRGSHPRGSGNLRTRKPHGAEH